MFNERLKSAKVAANNYLNTVEQRALQNEKKIRKQQTFDFDMFLLVKLTLATKHHKI